MCSIWTFIQDYSVIGGHKYVKRNSFHLISGSVKVLAEMGHTDELTIGDGKIVAKYDERGDKCFEEINKWDFYDKTRAKSKVVTVLFLCYTTFNGLQKQKKPVPCINQVEALCC